jgi:uncharacterized protein (DUF302 family)
VDAGLVTIRSPYPVGETIDRLVAAATAAGAAEVGMQLRPTELVLFGHPRGGTPLMQEARTAGIDLRVVGAAVGG